MGLSNLTSSIRAKKGISITGLKSVEASIGNFNNLSPNILDSDGLLSIYDNIRNKRLSVGRNLLSFSIPHRNVNSIRWLKYNNTMNSNVSGFRFIRDATIVGIAVQVQGAGTGSFEVIEKLNATSNIATTVTMSSESHKVMDNINIDINKNSVIEVKSVSGEFSYPTFTVEFAWRL